MWIFGYGSLVWRPAFEYRTRRPGYVRGYMRRFWQASPDHRGTEESPGRVVTLLADPGAEVWGMAYQVAADVVDGILDQLDYREKAGYERHTVDMHSPDDHSVFAQGVIYIAGPGNPNFVGDHPVADIAAVARVAHGPSGANREYVLRLHQALVDMGAHDDHVSELARLVAGDGIVGSSPSSDST